ncbi:MAG: outer membrane protein assembly factor BamA [Parasphingorhabdus sp.]|jgi:outer membrane protein assembly factor BamA
MRVLGFLLLLSICIASWAEDLRVDAIVFKGNETTLAETLLQELTFVEGDTVTETQIDHGRQAIMDLGLFKQVKAQKVAQADGGYTVLITVSEKHYVLVLPRLSRSGDGDLSYGARVRFDNLGGRNRRLDLGVRRKDLRNSDIQSEDRIRLRYRLPRIWGTQFDVSFDVRSEDIEIDEERDGREGRFQQSLNSFRVNVSRWLGQRGPSQGWLARADLKYKDYENEYLDGDPDLFFDAVIVETTLGFEFRQIHDLLYSRSGRHLGYNLHLSSDALGSDVSYVRHSAFYRRYKPLKFRPHTNFNYQFRYQTSSGSVFGDPSYSLGGNSTIRGYERESQEGESLMIANLEFLTPIFGHNTLRGTLFMDIGGTFEESADFDSSDLVVGVGFGILYKLRSFVKTDLRLDFAYGIDDEDTKVYGSTETSF